MSNGTRDVDIAPDLSGLFREIKGLLQLQTLALRDILAALKQREGTFYSFAGGGSEMPVQKGINGTIRMIHNPSAQVIDVQLLDGNETPLWGSAANPMVIPAGGTQLLYIPFKNGFRAIVTAAGATNGFLAIGGDLKY